MTRTSTTVRCAAALGASVLVAAAAAAGAADAPVTTLTLGGVSSSATGITVAGTAAMAALPATEVGKDAAGDGALPGTDLTTASIVPLGGGKIAFDLGIGNLAPGVGSAPAVTHHNWEFSAASPDGETATTLSLKAINRGGVIAASSGGAADQPVFSLNSCEPDPQTGQNTCTATYVDGAYTATGVRFLLENTAVSALSGWTISPTGQGINVSPGASDALWFTNGAGGDTMGAEEFVVPTSVVRVGVAPAGTSLDEVALTTSKDVPGTAFNLKLPRPTTPGSYVVVAQACHADVCSPRTAKTVTVS